MHRHWLGSCRIELLLAPQSSWLVRGESPVRQSESTPSVQPLQYAPLAESGAPPVLPASSIKGVLRSTAEYILRSVDPERPEAARPLADTPFVRGEGQSLAGLPRGAIADSELLEWWEANPEQRAAATAQPLYPQLSAASQLFGATVHAGQLTLDDAVATPAFATRPHVAISRFTGGVVDKRLFSERLVQPQGTLGTTLMVTNFALWQLALLGLVFRELSRGFIGFGAGTRKGQGHMRVSVNTIAFQYAAHAYPKAHHGIVSAQARAADAPEAVRAIEAELDLLADQGDALVPPTGDWRDEGLVRRTVPPELCDAFFAAATRQVWKPWVLAMRKERSV
jgi:CRISPR/Cas system CSM-associated protein Csm3 (group 7 of RAMP superfamily)